MLPPCCISPALTLVKKALEIDLKEGLVEIGHGLWEGKLEKSRLPSGPRPQNAF